MCAFTLPQPAQLDVGMLNHLLYDSTKSILQFLDALDLVAAKKGQPLAAVVGQVAGTEVRPANGLLFSAAVLRLTVGAVGGGHRINNLHVDWVLPQGVAIRGGPGGGHGGEAWWPRCYQDVCMLPLQHAVGCDLPARQELHRSLPDGARLFCCPPNRAPRCTAPPRPSRFASTTTHPPTPVRFFL